MSYLELKLQFFGGRGSSGGKSSGGGGGSKASGTMSTNKSESQVLTEAKQLTEFPAGTLIEVTDSFGKTQTYIAHDQARMGRNGRYNRIRKYSLQSSGKDTTDPYYVAKRPWKKK